MPDTSALTVSVLSLQAQQERDLETIRRVAAKVELMLATDEHIDRAPDPTNPAIGGLVQDATGSSNPDSPPDRFVYKTKRIIRRHP